MKVGYIRISTEAQNMFRQEDLMKELGVERVFEDRASGKDTQRPGLKEMLGFVRRGDEVVVESISRLARSTGDLLNIVAGLDSNGISFVSKKEALDSKTPQGRFVLTIFAGLASLERETIIQRTKEGIEAARSRGKHLGRPIIEKPKDWDRVTSDWKAGKLTAVQVMKVLGLTKSTFYKMARK